jgi:hypothetical protein
MSNELSTIWENPAYTKSKHKILRTTLRLDLLSSLKHSLSYSAIDAFIEPRNVSPNRIKGKTFEKTFVLAHEDVPAHKQTFTNRLFCCLI